MSAMPVQRHQIERSLCKECGDCGVELESDETGLLRMTENECAWCPRCAQCDVHLCKVDKDIEIDGERFCSDCLEVEPSSVTPYKILADLGQMQQHKTILMSMLAFAETPNGEALCLRLLKDMTLGPREELYDMMAVLLEDGHSFDAAYRIVSERMGDKDL